MGWIINIIALLLFPLISIVDLFTRLFSKRSENSAYSKGFQLNVFANELFGSTFNILMLKEGFERFGRFGEPLSSAFGWSYTNNELNWHGKFWRFIIDATDIPMWWSGKSHCKEWRRSEKKINEYRETLN